jgi:hypothetical protein
MEALLWASSHAMARPRQGVHSGPSNRHRLQPQTNLEHHHRGGGVISAGTMAQRAISAVKRAFPRTTKSKNLGLFNEKRNPRTGLSLHEATASSVFLLHIIRFGPHRWFFTTSDTKIGVNIPGRRWHGPLGRRNVLNADFSASRVSHAHLVVRTSLHCEGRKPMKL